VVTYGKCLSKIQEYRKLGSIEALMVSYEYPNHNKNDERTGSR